VIRFRSVVSRIVALHLLAIVVTSIFMPVTLFLMLDHAAMGLHQRALREQAAEILRYLDIGSRGTPRLSLPPDLAAFYSEDYGRAAFAVLDRSGQVLFSSPPAKHPIAALPSAGKPFSSFRKSAPAMNITGSP